VAQDRWTAVDAYLTSLFVPPDPALDGVLQSIAAADLPTISVSPTQGKLLFILAKAMGARRVLELGTLAGYSTIWLARAIPPGGSVVTIEVDPRHAKIARTNFARAGVADRIDLRVGAALDVLPKLAATAGDPFDVIFIDADKVGYPDYLGWSIKLARPGTLILADNVIRDGAVADPGSKDASVQAVRRFNEMLTNEPRVIATAIQTVGAKGYDGFAAILVT
jgi:predicted O-methyltransferase YrrM